MVAIRGASFLTGSNKYVFEKEVGLKPSLQLIFYIRGTKGKTVGTSVNIQATVNYENAVEQNSTNQYPRQGLLILWQ